MNAPIRPREPRDYQSDQEVRWCPGCGDYAILRAVEKALARIGADPDRTVFVSGIGCAARFPYYVATYGFHGIHGRAPAIAAGVKIANPELDVWVVGGDGDLLSIGTNHLIHTIRRNLDLTILIFNNEVYGLTKGQLSPTSPIGSRTPTSPQGSVERPLSALRVALAAGARFVARAIDTDRELPDILVRAHDHPGTAVVEILQNCVVYHDGAFAAITAREVAADAQILPIPGEPLVFGRERDRALRLRADGDGLEVVRLTDVDPASLPRFDPRNRELAWMLAGLEPPLPVAIGVLRDDPAPEPYERALRRQEQEAAATGPRDLAELLRQGPVWVVPG